jgi:hypothetical protein
MSFYYLFRITGKLVWAKPIYSNNTCIYTTYLEKFRHQRVKFNRYTFKNYEPTKKKLGAFSAVIIGTRMMFMFQFMDD